MKKWIVLLLAASLFALLLLPASAVAASDPAFAQAAENAEGALVYLSDLTGAVGDEDLRATLSFANATGFTSCTIIVQYNPYMLKFLGFTPDSSVQDGSIYIMATEQQDTDNAGNIPHLVYIVVTHMEQFPEALDRCDIGSLAFRAVGGGECPLQVIAEDFAVQDEEVQPVIISGSAKIQGDVASTWDYENGVYGAITVGNEYEVTRPHAIPSWARIAAIYIASNGEVKVRAPEDAEQTPDVPEQKPDAPEQ